MKKVMTQKMIEAEIKRLQARSKAMTRKRRAALRGIVAQMKKHEITTAEVAALLEPRSKTSAPKKARKKPAAVPVKFQGPNGETWTGRGRAPLWLVTAEEAGKKREYFAV